VLILPRSCLLHVPKTGGSWVKKAILASDIQCEAFSPGGNHHPGLNECPAPDKFKFAFVRHPLRLYRSYWQYKMTYGWDNRSAIDEYCHADNFDAFVTRVITRMPGVYSQSIADFVGTEQQPIDFIGKYESLVEDLIKALTMAGCRFSENAIRALPPINVSNKEAFPAEYSPELEAAVLRTEAGIINRFNY
jgi:hypothetical protein